VEIKLPSAVVRNLLKEKLLIKAERKLFFSFKEKSPAK